MPNGEAQDAAHAGVPVGRSEHPQQIGRQRIAVARQLAVALPVLSVAVMGEMLDLVEIARIEQHEAEQPAENLVELLGAEHRPVADLVLAGIEEVDQHAMRDEEGNGEPAAPGEP